MYFSKNQQGLGATMTDITSALTKATDPKLLAAAQALLDDPYLPEISRIVLELQAIEKRRVGKSWYTSVGGLGSLGAASPSSPGVGLKRFVKPLRFYVQTRKDPYKGILAIAAVLGVPFVLGYIIGKK